MFHANTAHVRTSGQYITQASYTTTNSMCGNSYITLNSNTIQRRWLNVTMSDDEREWVYVQVLQRFPGLDIYRAGQAGYDEHARTPDICDDVMTVTNKLTQAQEPREDSWMMTDEEAGSHKLRRFQNTDGIHTDHPGRAPKCSTRSNVCSEMCVPENWTVGQGTTAEEK